MITYNDYLDFCESLYDEVDDLALYDSDHPEYEITPDKFESFRDTFTQNGFDIYEFLFKVYRERVADYRKN